MIDRRGFVSGGLARSLKLPDNNVMRCLALLLLTALVLGCGGLGVPQVSTATNGVSPTSVTIARGQTVQFQMMKDGIPVDEAFWSCDGGSIDSEGKYRAPDTSGIYEVTATTHSQSSSAIVLVN